MAKQGSYNPGPVSAAGKDAASRNATVHGGRMTKHRLLPGERQEDFDALVDKWTVELTPKTEVERGYVGTIAEREWMVRRCERNADSVLFDLTNEKPDPRTWTKDEQNAMTVMQRYLTTAQRQMDAALKAFKDLRRSHVEQRKLEESTKLKIAEVMRKLELADKVQEVVKARLDGQRVQELRSKNVGEWELRVLRAQDEALAREQEEGRV